MLLSSNVPAAAAVISDAKVAAIQALLTLCERATINLNDSLGNAVRACIVVCLKFVDKRAVYDALLKETFIDWEYITGSTLSSSSVAASAEKPRLLYPTEANLAVANAAAAAAAASNSSSSLSSYLRGIAAKKTNLLGDSDVWLQLMQFVDFGDLQIPERLLQQQYPPLYCMHLAAKTGNPNLNFSDSCKLLLLNNIEGLSSRNVLELYTSSRLNQNTYALCSGIINTLADERHASSVYEATFRYILSPEVIKVDEALLAKYIAHFRMTADARKRAWQLKHIQNRVSRPSMRKIAARNCGVGGGSTVYSVSEFGGDDDTESVRSGMTMMSTTTAASAMGVSAMTFEQHSAIIRYPNRYPNSMSNLRRLRCYLMACQQHNFDYSKHMEGLVPSDVAAALRDNPVVFPDTHSVYLAIESLAMNVVPFEELNQFRARCFLSFAIHQKKNLSLTQVLKLYVAAYQAKSIWKQLWTSIYPVISPQIVRDVETFVGAVPFAVEPFVKILKTSSPFVASV